MKSNKSKISCKQGFTKAVMLNSFQHLHLKRGFTLIELLVVVLIIGILAAVAVPQYQKAVEKSKATQAMTLIKDLYQAQKAFYLANDRFATSFEELDIDIPWAGNTKYIDKDIPTRSNEDWSVQLYQDSNGTIIYVGRISGKYAGVGGFEMILDNKYYKPSDTLLCHEKKMANGSTANGAYCVKLFNGIKTNGSEANYIIY